MNALRLLPRQVLDLGPRFTLFVVVAAWVVAPLWATVHEHAPRAVEALAGGGVPAPGLYRLTLIGAAVWLWEGVASGIRRNGTYRFLLSRPVSRAALHAVLWAAPLPWLLLVGGAWAVTTALTLGSSAPVLAASAAALSTGLFVGSLVLLLSAVLERGDALLATLLLLADLVSRFRIPSSASTGWVHGSLTLLLRPLAEWHDLTRELAMGTLPPPGAWVAPAAFAGASLVGALVILAKREMR